MVEAQQSTEMQRVWRLVQELAAQVSANQQETERLRRHIDLSQHSALADTSSDGTTRSPGVYSKQDFVAVSDENAKLKLEVEDLSHLCAEYEVGLTQAMNQIRQHEYEVTNATLELHRNYQSRIDAQSRENQVLQSDVTEMRGQLIKLNGLVRTALVNHSDMQAETVIETLTLENEALRSRIARLEDLMNQEETQAK